MSAPLLIGSAILNMSDWDYQTYTNAEVIAIDQDTLGYVAASVCVPGNIAVFACVLS